MEEIYDTVFDAKLVAGPLQGGYLFRTDRRNRNDAATVDNYT
jgi:hypothetical protein